MDLDGVPSTISFPHVECLTTPLFDDLQPRYRNSFVNAVVTLTRSTMEDGRWHDIYYFQNKHTGEWLTLVHVKRTQDINSDDLDEEHDFLFLRGRVEPTNAAQQPASLVGSTETGRRQDKARSMTMFGRSARCVML